MIPLVDLKAQYNSIKDEIDGAIQNVIDASSFIMGEDVEKFEKEFADFCNAKYAVGTSNGTTALHLAAEAIGIKLGDEIITSPNTFIATVEPFLKMGAKIKFADIDEYYTIDANKIEEKITEKTKAIIPVHLYGQPADMQPIKEIAEKHNLKIIEDCAQAHNSEYNNKKIPVTDIGCFSFFPGKNLGAFGDAGAIIFNDKELAERIRNLSNHGRKNKYEHNEPGYNFRLDSMQAAILRVKLKYLGKWTDMRINNAKLYNEFLENENIILPKRRESCKHVFHLYVIRVKDREKLQKYLTDNGIATGIHYPVPLHLQPFYNKKESHLLTEKYSREILSLPMFPEFKEEQIKFVCDKIKEYVKK